MNYFCSLLLILTSLCTASAALNPEETLSVSPQLADQIDAVLAYYQNHGQDDPLCQGDMARRRLTALYQLKTMMSSEKRSAPWSLNFLKINFRVQPITPKGSIRLTRYAAFSVKGRRKADKTHNTPLLDLPADEKGLSEAQADALRPDLLRFRHSRADVLRGLLQPDISRPLAWLTLHAFDQAQMQGSVQVVFEGGERALFNVSRSNGRPWKKGRSSSSQERYWFFRETGIPLGYGLWSDWQLPIFPMAALAGDLRHFGLGALVLLQNRNSVILAILADTGGAFEDNRTQLDLFLGIMETQGQFKRLHGSLPERFEAFILE